MFSVTLKDIFSEKLTMYSPLNATKIVTVMLIKFIYIRKNLYFCPCMDTSILPC